GLPRPRTRAQPGPQRTLDVPPRRHRRRLPPHLRDLLPRHRFPRAGGGSLAMALSGTLKDFGIADILQLIGHQTKTGKLVLKNGPEEVDVLFVEGNVVLATDKARQKESLLGSMLLRA